jgi:hypothetical protein
MAIHAVEVRVEEATLGGCDEQSAVHGERHVEVLVDVAGLKLDFEDASACAVADGSHHGGINGIAFHLGETASYAELRGRCCRWQTGQRGNQRTRTRAMASRRVANESAKWRSGRERDRTTATSPSGLGGKMPHALSDDEGVAAEGDRHVVMPAGEGTTFEVIEPQLTLLFFVDALGAVAFFEEAHDLLFAHGTP